MDVTGRIHSVETCGAVDGPGIRFVLFLQGCPLRCQYCHNPDTWNPQIGREVTVSQIMGEILQYKSYMKFSGGGVTVSGGEPLLQPRFVEALFACLHKEGIHTALDTSGFAPLDRAKPVLDLSDLVLLDMKSFSPQTFKTVTGVDQAPTLCIAEYLSNQNIAMWVRFVLVPGLTDHEDEIKDMALYLSRLKNVKKIEVIPFHKMGEYKWAELNFKYRLADTPAPHKRDVEYVKGIFREQGLAVG